MARDADIVVVGAGIVGAATARALAGTFGTVDSPRAVRSRARARLESRDLSDLPAQLPRRAVRPHGAGRRGRLARARARARRAAPRAERLARPRAGRRRDRTRSVGLRRSLRDVERRRGPLTLAAPTRRGRDGGLPGRRRDRPRRQRPPCAPRERCRRRRGAPRERPGAVARAGAERRPGHARQRRALGTVRRRHGRLLVAPAPRGRRDRAYPSCRRARR